MMQQYTPQDFENVTLGRKLGSGSFGTVHVGLLNDGRYVAVKTLDLAPENTTGTTSEVETHSRFCHPNIIRYLYSKIDRSGENPKLVLFLEFVTGGSVTSIMKSLAAGKLPPPVVRVYARHLFQGLQYLHENGAAHRDIKGDNVLISQDTGVAKLADFDQAKVMAGSVRGPSQTLAGTPFWMAPEMITQEQGYNPFKADIWSAGCTVAEMFTGKAPWLPMSSPMAIIYKVANTKEWPDAIPNDVNVLGPQLHDFLSKCFTLDPEKRPSAEELLKHPYLAL